MEVLRASHFGIQSQSHTVGGARWGGGRGARRSESRRGPHVGGWLGRRSFIEPRTAPQQQESFALAKGSQGWLEGLRTDVIENDPGEGSCRFWAFQT